MLQFNTDCQLAVLQYVRARSDLRSLCLTSKELHQLAVPLLYKRIDVRLWSQGNTAWVIEHMEQSEKYLQYTRELVVEDERITEETKSVQYGDIGLPYLTNHYRYHVPDNEERDDNLLEILQLIPRDALPFSHGRALSTNTLTHLSLWQRNIDDLQISLGHDKQPFTILPMLRQRETGLRRLDVHIVGYSDVTYLLSNICTIEKNLQYLSINVQDTLDVAQSIRDRRCKDKTWMIELKELRLVGLTLMDLYPSLSKMISFCKLSKLHLLKCAGAFNFLSHLTAGATPNLQLNPTHFALDRFDSDDGHGNPIKDPEDERNIALDRLLKACKSLSSLHIGLSKFTPLPPAFKTHLEIQGTTLRSLSLYTEGFEIPDNRYELVSSCCPNIEQLAVVVAEECFDAGMGCGNLEWVADSVRRLHNLRLLHLRCPKIDYLGGLKNRDGNECNMEILAMQIQSFANLMFGELYNDPDFKLEALVIGHLSLFKRIDQNGNEINYPHYMPQFCFVRGQQRDFLGRTATVGVPVSRAVLRRTFPDTSILDVDPGVEKWEQWVGQAI